MVELVLIVDSLKEVADQVDPELRQRIHLATLAQAEHRLVPEGQQAQVADLEDLEQVVEPVDQEWVADLDQELVAVPEGQELAVDLGQGQPVDLDCQEQEMDPEGPELAVELADLGDKAGRQDQTVELVPTVDSLREVAVQADRKDPKVPAQEPADPTVWNQTLSKFSVARRAPCFPASPGLPS